MRKPRWQNIRRLLEEAFNDEALRVLCYDQPLFKGLYNHFSRQTRKTQVIDPLLQQARHPPRLEALLAWAEEAAPADYARHQPYYETITARPASETPAALCPPPSFMIAARSWEQLPAS